MKRIGKQEPRYDFFLNPYQDYRFTRCPKCQEMMRQRKLPLVIHVHPQNLMVLNKTCRYCPTCDLLIAQQDEVEGQLAHYFAQHNPAVIGNEYLVLGTVDRASWKQGMANVPGQSAILDQLHDFKKYLTFELRGGWGPAEPAAPTSPEAPKSPAAATAGALAERMKAQLPISAYPAPELARLFRQKGWALRPEQPVSIEKVFDGGEVGGILCGLAQPAGSKEALVVSLTHLRIPPSNPLAAEVQRYQRERVRQIGRSSA